MKGVFLLVALFGLQGYSQGEECTEELTNLINTKKGENLFSWDLFKVALNNEPGNFIVSPFDAYYQLGQAYISSEGATRAALEKALHFGTPRTPENWIDPARSIGPLINQMHALPFAKFDSDEYPENQNGEETTLLITNASNHGKWKLPFDPRSTYSGSFRTNRGDIKRVPTMAQHGRYQIARLPGFHAQVVVLPYQDGGVQEKATHMYLIQPYSNSLQHIEAHVEKLPLQRLRSIESTLTTLTIPKFRIQSQLNLKSYFAQLGIEKAFKHPENKSGDYASRWSFPEIDRIVQTASIEVDEGISAAPSGEHSLRFSRRSFNIDGPFLVVVATDDVILFTGRVVDPTL